MNIFNRFSLAVAALSCALALALPASALAATTPSLGAAATYGVLSSTYTDTSAATTINGDVGFTTGPSSAIGGTHLNYGSGAPYSTAGTNEGSALSALASQPCTFTFASGPIDLSTDTTHGSAGIFTPGVYCSTGAMNISGPLSLSGGGTFIFRPSGALTSTAGSMVTVTGGASACNTFWTPTQATTLGANTIFAGTDIDDSGITVGANTAWMGGALAFGGTVTTDTNTVTVPNCSLSPTANLHVIKLVVNASGGTAVASDFTLHVLTGLANVAGSPQAGTSTPGTLYTLAPGTYTVSEDANALYTETFAGDCDASGSITLAANDDKTCTIVNTDIPPPAAASSAGPGAGSGAPVIYLPRIVPLIGILKVPTPLALPAGSGPVTYAYTVWDVGTQQALADVSVVDDKCSPLTLVSGDTNQNGLLDPGENWHYTCTMTLGETTTNTAVVTGYSNDPYHTAAIDTAVATVVVGAPVPPPLISILKVPSRLTPFPFGGGVVTYTYTVTNPGIVAMNNVTVTDNTCAPTSFASGDTNANNLLDPGEVWTYTCTTNVPVSTRNTATATGHANGLTAIDYAFATVLVTAPGLPNTGFPPQGNALPRDIVILAGFLMIVAASFTVVLRKGKA